VLDQIAEAQIKFREDHSEHWHGPLSFPLLHYALPLRGKNRNWSHAVAIWMLEAIIDAYNTTPERWPWKGPLYQFHRRVFSKRYGVSPKTVSRNLSWLVKNGLVGRCHKPVVADDDGKTLSRRLYVWPRLDNIVRLLEEAKVRILERGKQREGPSSGPHTG